MGRIPNSGFSAILRKITSTAFLSLLQIPPAPPKKTKQNRRFKFCFKRCCLVGERETLTWKTNEGRDVDGFVFADKAEVARLSFFSLTV